MSWITRTWIAVLFGFSSSSWAGEEDHAEPPILEPETIDDVAPRALVVDGDPKSLRIDVTRSPLEAWPGVELQVRVTNDGDAPVTIEGVRLLDDVRGRATASSYDLRVLAIRPERTPGVDTRALAGRIESRRMLLAATPSRRSAVGAAFLDPTPETETRIALEPDDQHFHLSAEALVPDRALNPGDSFVAPTLIVFFSPDGRFALEWLLDALDAPAADPDVVAARREGALGPDESTPRPLGFRREDRRIDPTRATKILPIDLFSEVAPRIWPTAADGATVDLLLVNPEPEAAIISAAFSDLGLARTGAYDVTGQGRCRTAFTCSLPPRSIRRVRVESAAAAELESGFRLVAIAPPSFELPSERIELETNDPELPRRLVETLANGGAVIANHRSTTVLEPLPRPLDEILPAVVRPYRATKTIAPGSVGRDGFLERSSNLLWALDVPPPPSVSKDAGVWLVCPQAGFDATPLHGTIADGLYAARGFAVPARAGLALITIGLTDAEVERIADDLLDLGRRSEALRAAGGAMHAVRQSRPDAGLFEELHLDRLTNQDLVPGDPFVISQWSALVPDSRKSVLELKTRGGGPIRDDVVHVARPLIFALDVPPRFEHEIVLVVRRAPSEAIDDYVVMIDTTPVSAPVSTRTDGRDSWQEDLLVFGPDVIGRRTRFAMSVRPRGGSLPLARIGFFVKKKRPGISLDGVAARVVEAGEVGLSLDRSAGGRVLRMAGEAFAGGIGTTAGTVLEFDLDGRFSSLLARVGIDAEVGPAGTARIRILVDDEERLATDPLVGGAPPVPITIDVRGGKRLRLIVEDGGDGAADDHVDIVDARLIDA